MIAADDIGGVHIKYLYHCPRQLWLYSRGMRPEHLSDAVRLGEAVHDTSYKRARPVDLGAARLDDLDGDLWVHETKSSARSSPADEAQAIHYCHRLRTLGVPVKGAVLHYPRVRRTRRLPYNPEWQMRAENDIADALRTISLPASPERLPRNRCKGCSYFDYCWSD